MSHKIADKILLTVIITAAIVLLSEGVTAVHVCVALGAVIIAAYDEIFRHRYILCALGLATAIIAGFIPVAVMAIPMSVYVLVHRRSAIEHAFAAALVLAGVILATTPAMGAVVFFISALAAYISYSTSYYTDTITRFTDMFDEARHEAHENARKRRELLEKSDAEVYTARLKERNRIAREIHDNVGHQITRVIVQMQALKIINKDENVGKQLDSVSETLDLAMTGIRRSVHELHDDSIDLAIGINDIAKTLPERFTADVATSIESPADNNTKTAILGIIKEAVTNIAKHSDGDKVRIEVVENISFWRVNVHDNGVCPQKEYSLSSVETSDGHGIGLSNIFDRASGMGGRCSIRSGSDGFDVLVTIPKKESKS